MNHTGLPAELKAMSSWCVWKWVTEKNKKTGEDERKKIPYQLDGVNKAKSNDSSTWTTFARAYAAFTETDGTFDGICWMMPVKPGKYIFTDIDHCVTDGIIEAWAHGVVKEFDSYSEISQSGHGIHIIIVAKKPIKRCRKNGSPYEIYDSVRACFLTGDVIDAHTTIEGRQEPLDALFAEIFPAELERARNPQAPRTPPAHTSLSDETLILKATLSKGGDKFKALWDGSTLGYGDDDSAADQALCNRLAFWTGKDAAQIERLFSQSGLGKRDKWQNRPDYRERTIQKAIDDTTEVYEPRQESQEQPKDRPVLEYKDCFITELKEKDGVQVYDPVTGKPKEESHFSADHTKKSIVKKFDLAMVKGDEKTIWRFDENVFCDNGRPYFRDAVYSVAKNHVRPKDVNEVLDRLTATLMMRPVTFNPDPFLFPALDGVLDLKTGETRDGTPSDLMTFKYNALCDHPDADYDRFLFYLASSLPDLRDCLTAIDLYTKAVIRVPFDTFAFLLGGGENGKGIFEKVLITLLGMDRVSAAKFDEFKRSHFALGSLLDKDVWVITEVETAKDATAVIKAVSSGEMIDSDAKYKTNRERGMPHLLPILDSNKALDFKDPSWGRKRRTLKLDFPFEFGYKPESRPKDPHLLDKLTSPESLAGILQLIKARAPSLIAARKIYRRKSSEEQEAELDRQRFSLQYFCNDCLVKEADWPEKIDPLDKTTQPPRLTTDKAFELYREYCKLWNVPEPAEKVPLGRYISEKFGVESVVGSTKVDGKQKSYRFYSGLFCSKSPVTAHAEIYVEYSEILQRTTDILQMWIGEKDISKEITTDTTDKHVIFDAIDRLEAMYKYVQSCTDPRDICYKGFKAHLSVVSVVSQKNGPIDSEKKNYRCTTDAKPSVVSGSPDNELQMNRIQAEAPSTYPPTTSDVDVKVSFFEVEPPHGMGHHPRKDEPIPARRKA